MDPNPWLDPVMPSLLSMLRTKVRTLSRDLHVPEPAPRDRCSNFDQFQASIALKVAADTKSMAAQQNVSLASSAQIPFSATHNVTSAKEQTSSHTTLTQSACEDNVQVVLTRLLVALDWLQQQPSSQSASTAEPSQHALLHEALVSLIHKLLLLTLFICLFVCLFIYCVFVCLFVYLSIYLSIYLFIYLFI